MDTYSIYKALKQYLKDQDIAPIFFFAGQYSGDNKTKYKVPAIYIEIVGPLPVKNFAAVRSAPATIRLHFLSHAPYGSISDIVQDSTLASHVQNFLKIVNSISGASLYDESNRLICGQFIVNSISPPNFVNTTAVSVVQFISKLYDYSANSYVYIRPTLD